MGYVIAQRLIIVRIYFIVKRPKYILCTDRTCLYDTCKCFTLCVPYTDAMLLNISLVDVGRARSNRSQNKSKIK